MRALRMLLPLLAVGWPAEVAVQTLIRGTIRGAGRPLPGAEVRLNPGGGVAHADTAGVYHVVAGKGGVVHVAVRAVGFYPAGRTILVVQGDTLTCDFTLDAAPQQLESLSVEAPGVVVRGKLAAFDERRRAGIGRFITRAMLAEREHSTMADVLRMTPGLRLIRRPSDCGGGFSVGTGRGGTVQWQPWMVCGRGTAMEAACYFTIVLDGARYWLPGSREPPDINDFQVHGIQAMEIYRGPAETPIQYLGTNSTCGVVLLWTRDGS